MTWTRISRPDSRLMRAIKRNWPGTPPVELTLISPDGAEILFVEDEITEISVQRGADDDYDIIPHVLQFSTPREFAGLRSGYELTLKVADQTRFRGRATTDTVDERPGMSLTNVTASSWSVMFDWTNPTWPGRTHPGFGPMFQSLIDLRSLGINYYPTSLGDRVWDYYGDFSSEDRYSDLIAKVTADSGIAVLNRMEGRCVIRSYADRREQVAAIAGRILTVPRSAVSSPIQLSQPTEALGRRQAIRWTDRFSHNVYLTGFANPWTNYDYETVVHDREWWRTEVGGAQLSWGQVLAYRATANRYRLPSITIELLPLLLSDSPARRDLGRYLLTLEAGDPIPFGNDWTREGLRGFHFATGINETITHNKWTLTLSLASHVLTVGTNTPVPSGITWDTASTADRWDTLNIAWEDYP